MAAEDVEGELLTAAGEFYAAARLVDDQAGIGESFHHRGGGSRYDAHGGCEAAHRDHRVGAGGALLEVKLLEVVFDGAGGHIL